MKLVVTEEAAAWYKSEMGLKEGDYLRFFVQIYGQHQVHPNYSVGVARQVPRRMVAHALVGGITFYVEEQDEWFIREHELSVRMRQGEVEMELTPA